MTRTRNKTKNLLSTTTSMNNSDRNQDINGTSSVLNSTSEAGRKRAREDSDSLEPPPKRKNDKESPKKCAKRRLSSAEDQNPNKKMKFKHNHNSCCTWHSFVNSGDQKNSISVQNIPENIIVASYNMHAYTRSFSSLNQNNDIPNEIVNIQNAFAEELKRINPDIVCFQEIDVNLWNSHFKIFLENHGYTGEFVSNLSTKFGIATMFKLKKYKVEEVIIKDFGSLCSELIVRLESGLSKVSPLLDEVKNSCMFTVLRENRNQSNCKNNVIIVANALFSDVVNKCDIKCIQISALFWNFNDLLCKYHKADAIPVQGPNNGDHHIVDAASSSNAPGSSSERPQACWIVCGNVNGSDPTMATMCTSGYPDEGTLTQLQNCAEPKLIAKYWRSFQHTINTGGSPYLDMDYNPMDSYIWIDTSQLQANRVMQCTNVLQNNNNVVNHSPVACELSYKI